MTDRWASLYLLAVERLGDEDRAGDLVLHASSHAQLEHRLSGYGPLPNPLPEAPDEVISHVARLRQRATRRRRLAVTWGAAAVALLAFAGAVLATRGESVRKSPGPERKAPREPAAQTIAVDQLMARGGLGVYIKSVLVKPDATVVAWQPTITSETLRNMPQYVAIHGLETDRGPAPFQLIRDGYETEFGPLPPGATSMTLRTSNLLPVEATLPLQAGESDHESGMRITGVRQSNGLLEVDLEGPAIRQVLSAELVPRQGAPVRRAFRMSGSIRDGQIAMVISFDAPEGGGEFDLHVAVLQPADPLELTVPLTK